MTNNKTSTPVVDPKSSTPTNSGEKDESSTRANTNTTATSDNNVGTSIDNPVDISSINKDVPAIKEGAPINATKHCETINTIELNNNKTNSTEKATVSKETTIHNTTSTDKETFITINGVTVKCHSDTNPDVPAKEEADSVKARMKELKEMVDLTNKKEYHFKEGQSVHTYFEKLVKFLRGLGIPDFTRDTMINMLKVEKLSQLGKVGLDYEYMGLQYAGTPVSNLDFIRQIHTHAHDLLFSVFRSSNYDGLLADTPELMHEPEARSEETQAVVKEAYKRANLRLELTPAYAPAGVLVYLAKKLNGCNSGNRLSSTLEENEGVLLGTNLGEEWKTKTTLGPYSAFEASLKKQMVDTKNLLTNNLTGVLIWTKFFAEKLTGTAKVDFLTSMKKELNRAEASNSPFNVNVVSDFYDRCDRVGGVTLVHSNKVTTIQSLSETNKSHGKRKAESEVNVEGNGNGNGGNPRKKKKSPENPESQGPLEHLPRGRGIRFPKPVGAKENTKYQWCETCGASHPKNAHVFNEAGTYTGGKGFTRHLLAADKLNKKNT